MSYEKKNLEVRIGINGGRTPWINSEKIKQLKVYARETQRKIMKMEKYGTVDKREIVLEKQLLLSIQLKLQDQKRNAIDSEFFNLDYFQKL